MDDKRCPVCGMSVEGYQTKCECGFEFKGKTDEEIKDLAKNVEKNRKIGILVAIPVLLMGVFSKALVAAGYYWILIAVVTVLVLICAVCYIIDRKSKNKKDSK